ncbi:MAG: hypothetical protein HOH43_15535 [Candidatus Latescibacteria bacterium]|nr:hypothetical protein [Candidatus Latescibacterota bacterium]
MAKPSGLSLLVVLILYAGCGGSSTSELTIVNTIQSSESIRVDLGGDIRLLQIGDISQFRSVTQGQHVLLIESTTCVGTTHDTLLVRGDTTVRYFATRDITSGECLVSSSVAPTTKSLPISMFEADASRNKK